jgi:hypothetical protein
MYGICDTDHFTIKRVSDTTVALREVRNGKVRGMGYVCLSSDGWQIYTGRTTALCPTLRWATAPEAAQVLVDAVAPDLPYAAQDGFCW